MRVRSAQRGKVPQQSDAVGVASGSYAGGSASGRPVEESYDYWDNRPEAAAPGSASVSDIRSA